MTSTERVTAAIEFRAPDRVPHWESLLPEFVELWRRCKSLDDRADPRDCYRMDVAIGEPEQCFFPSQRGVVREEGRYLIERDGWGRTVRVGRQDSYFPQTLDTVLRSPADLDRLQFEPADAEVRFEGFDERVAHERAAGRCIFAKMGGLYIRTHFLRGEEALLMDMASDEGFCDELLDRVTEYFTSMAIETLKRTDAWDTGLFVYDDMASLRSPMFSPRMFERYLMPRYQRLIARCREAGCKHVFFDSDGNIGPILDLLLDCGFEGFHPLERRAGLDPVRIREKYGKRAVLFGGVCNSVVLPRGDRKEIEAHVRPLLELGRSGGLVFGTHSIASDVSVETYEYYISLLDKYGTG